MKRETSRRQRLLFHKGPVWQQLDEPLQQELIERLADICHLVVATPAQPLTDKKEQPDDNRNN